MELKFYSHHGEDEYLWNLFQGKKDGVFLDIGAGNGTTASVSYFFEQVGWTGVCVEPHPVLYLECLRVRRQSRVLHVALSRRGSWGVSNFVVVLGEDTRSFLASSGKQLEHAKQEGKRLSQLPVPLAFADVLIEGYTEKLDFVNCDIGGNEVDVLDGLTLSKYQPRVLLIGDASGGEVRRVEDHCARAGYRLVQRLGYKEVYLASVG
jgi:FkbM family methyltransferase